MKPESSTPRRIVVTGMGTINPLSFDLDEFWNACASGTSGVSRLELGGEPIPIKYAGQVHEFTGSIDNFGNLQGTIKKDIRKSLKLMSREIQMGVASAQRALQDAGLDKGVANPARVGVSYGADYIITTIDELTAGVLACQSNGTFDSQQWALHGMPKMTPLWQLKFLTNMITSHISILNQFYGVGCNVTNRESSIGALVSEAAEIIRSGKADIMVVGASGSRLHPLRIINAIRFKTATESTEFPPEQASRPYDFHRSGEVLGEGAGALILEDAEGARKRGARIYAEIVGGAHNCVLSPDPRNARSTYFQYDSPENTTRSLALSLREMFKKTAWAPEAVGHINGQGQSSVSLDAAECGAIADVFGNLAKTLPLTTIKGHIGNAGAGGDANDLIASILSLGKGTLFPVLNYTDPDPTCPVNVVRTAGVPSGDSFVKTCCHSLGQTSALLVSRWKP